MLTKVSTKDSTLTFDQIFEKNVSQVLLFRIFRWKSLTPFLMKKRGIYRGEELAPSWIQEISNSLWVKPHMAIACRRGWLRRFADLLDRVWVSVVASCSREKEEGRRTWGCWRDFWGVWSVFSGFRSRGEGESERGGDAGEREGEERGREGETRWGEVASVFWGFSI